MCTSAWRPNIVESCEIFYFFSILSNFPSFALSTVDWETTFLFSLKLLTKQRVKFKKSRVICVTRFRINIFGNSWTFFWNKLFMAIVLMINSAFYDRNRLISAAFIFHFADAVAVWPFSFPGGCCCYFHIF